MLEKGSLMYVFWQMIYALSLTVLIEEGVARLLRIRSGEAAFGILVINCFTNPILNAVLLLVRFFLRDQHSEAILYGVTILLEIAVVFAEGCFFRKKRIYPKNPFRFSLIVNAASFGCGILIDLFTSI